MASQQVTFDEYIAVSALTFDWADSYDTKDWTRLKSILAPFLEIDYETLNGLKDLAMPSETFIESTSGPKFLGTGDLHTQHLVGGSKYTKISENEILGAHQVRAGHVLYEDESRAVVSAQANGYGVTELKYKREGPGGVWKLAGIRPTVYWFEHDFHKLLTICAERADKKAQK